jgi:hypothetical protein
MRRASSNALAAPEFHSIESIGEFLQIWTARHFLWPSRGEISSTNQ